MSSFSSIIWWGLLLSIALMAPVSLPAGGSTCSRGVVRRSDKSGPSFAGDFCELRASPSSDAPSLRMISVGTPMRILRAWKGPDGDDWLQIQIISFELTEVIGTVTRGWVNV